MFYFERQGTLTKRCTIGVSSSTVVICAIISCDKRFKDWQRLQLLKIFSIFENCLKHRTIGQTPFVVYFEYDR